MPQKTLNTCENLGFLSRFPLNSIHLRSLGFCMTSGLRCRAPAVWEQRPGLASGGMSRWFQNGEYMDVSWGSILVQSWLNGSIFFEPLKGRFYMIGGWDGVLTKQIGHVNWIYVIGQNSSDVWDPWDTITRCLSPRTDSEFMHRCEKMRTDSMVFYWRWFLHVGHTRKQQNLSSNMTTRSWIFSMFLRKPAVKLGWSCSLRTKWE